MEIEELYLFKVQFGVMWPTDRNKYKCPRAKHIKQELPPQEQFPAKQLVFWFVSFPSFIPYVIPMASNPKRARTSDENGHEETPESSSDDGM